MEKEFDIIIIGGGHAGIEASLISSKYFFKEKKKIALITLNKKNIGMMPCNPSIGGPAKGNLVMEIDALGGEMGKAADATALQFKLLNTSGGAAIQALRVQSDKILYSRYMQEKINKQDNLTVIENIVEKIIVKNKKAGGVFLKTGEKINSKIVILTGGTYLNPITYKGKENKKEGPDGEKKVNNNISDQLKKLGFKLKRFKTGTSPRILTNSINFSKMKIEEGTNLPLKFSSETDISKILPFSQQHKCYLIHTNEKTHEIIKKNSHLSPIFYKKEIVNGPRYCPSIEHKVCIFFDKESHQIFLEPESVELKTTYIQGLSTSLPKEIQEKILKTLPGLEKAKIEKWGYAIEYDVIDSTQLKINLESKIIKNLFTAGQINGTTGYEEAAGQGLIAGINACLKLKKKKSLILKRNEAYLGVLIEDLINKEINDPYRLLTSRSEYRLLLRYDNVYTRLWPISHKIKMLEKKKWKQLKDKKKIQKKITKKLKEIIFPVDEKLKKRFPFLDIKKWKTIKKINSYNLLKKTGIFLINFEKDIKEIKDLKWEEQRELETEIKYEGYIKRQIKEIKDLKKYENREISEKIDYSKIENLSKEAREKLSKIKPFSLGQAMRISGINHNDIQILNSFMNKII